MVIKLPSQLKAVFQRINERMPSYKNAGINGHNPSIKEIGHSKFVNRGVYHDLVKHYIHRKDDFNDEVKSNSSFSFLVKYGEKDDDTTIKYSFLEGGEDQSSIQYSLPFRLVDFLSILCSVLRNSSCESDLIDSMNLALLKHDTRFINESIDHSIKALEFNESQADENIVTLSEEVIDYFMTRGSDLEVIRQKLFDVSSILEVSSEYLEVKAAEAQLAKAKEKLNEKQRQIHKEMLLPTDIPEHTYRIRMNAEKKLENIVSELKNIKESNISLSDSIERELKRIIQCYKISLNQKHLPIKIQDKMALLIRK